MINYQGVLIFSLAFLLLFAIAEVLHYKIGVDKEISRKFSHIGGGIIALFFPIAFQSHWYILGLGIAFFILLFSSKKLGYLQSIHGVKRKSVGSTIYPISIYFCFWLASLDQVWSLFYVPVLVMVFADSAAYFVGTTFGWVPYKIGKGKKTISGSFAFFAVSFLVFLLFNQFGGTAYSFGMIVMISLGAALVEALSADGWDNVTVPILMCLVLYFLL